LKQIHHLPLSPLLSGHSRSSAAGRDKAWSFQFCCLGSSDNPGSQLLACLQTSNKAHCTDDLQGFLGNVPVSLYRACENSNFSKDYNLVKYDFPRDTTKHIDDKQHPFPDFSKENAVCFIDLSEFG